MWNVYIRILGGDTYHWRLLFRVFGVEKNASSNRAIVASAKLNQTHSSLHVGVYVRRDTCEICVCLY